MRDGVRRAGPEVKAQRRSTRDNRDKACNLSWRAGAALLFPNPMITYLDFEKPVAELDAKIAELEAVAAKGDGPSIGEELSRLKEPATQAPENC